MKNLRYIILHTVFVGALGVLAGFAQAVTFQAEDYGAHFDTTAGNQGGAYRSDNVDIEATSDTGGGFDVGWIAQSEWLVYNSLVIPSNGNYTIRMRVASPSGATASVDLNGGSIKLGNINIPPTGGWQNWQTVTINANINAGTYSLGVYAQTGGWNFNWIEVVPNGSGGNEKAVLYEDCPYSGWAVPLDVGRYNLSALRARGFVNDKLSSIQVTPGYEAVLYQDDNFTGTSVVINHDDNCLNNQGFNDVASSVVIRKTSNNNNPVWSDEFNTLNLNTWTFETGGGGWGNNELEYYTGGQNAYIQYDNSAGSNVLVLEARQENPANYNCWYGYCNYTSTRMVSRNKKTFKYGRIEARLKLPQTQGIWPAFWMLGDDLGQVGWPQSGEIDIMEHVGFEPSLTHGALHGPGYSGNTPILGTNDVGQSVSAGYHVYAIEWDTNSIRWYMDNHQFYSATRAQVQQYGNWVYDHPFFLLLNLAVGGSWPGSPDGSSQFPQRMYVDYIRVYQ